MLRHLAVASLLVLGLNSARAEQLSTDPFPPIEATKDVIGVNFVEFARIPDAEGGEAPRLMHMIAEPDTKRQFVSTMRGMIYSVSYDGKEVTPFLDLNAANWGFGVQFAFQERGLHSFAFHPQFATRGKPGYGKFYTYADTSNITPAPDFTSGAKTRSHDTVLLEWTMKNPAATTYDGDKPKELIRVAQPFVNHNGGQIAFNPLAKANAADYGLLYIGLADGGSGGDPMNLAQNRAMILGKILRIDPLGTNSANGRYGIPASNPFAKGEAGALGEVYAYGLRNPQRFTWDAKTGRMLVADIGQNQIEEISPVTAGANLGWVKWEGNHKYVGGKVDLDNPHSEAGMTWPIVEFDHNDPILQRLVAITGITVNRSSQIKPLKDLLIFGDNPSGEIFYVKADAPGTGGQGAIRRILLIDGGQQKTLLQVINDKFAKDGKAAATRADLRFGFGPRQEIFLLNKRDGIIRLLVPAGSRKTGI